jgi:hypothetical protein
VLDKLEGDIIVNPNGYGRLNWDDSIETLQSIYPNANEAISYNINGEKMTTFRKFYMEENHLDNMKLTKTFDFDKNKLFSVTVDYGLLSLYHSGLIEYKLHSHYGKFDWLCLKIKDDKRIKYGFNIFDDNIRIILVIEEILVLDGENKNIYKIENRKVICIYESRKNDKKLRLFHTDDFGIINMKDYSKIVL